MPPSDDPPPPGLPNESGVFERHRSGYLLSTDRTRLQLDWVHEMLSRQSYWALGMPRATIERSVRGSLPFGIYLGPTQVAFARLITDFTRIAYLIDVFVDRTHRGRGLGVWMAEAMREHPDLSDVSRWLLSTRDAHGVYAKAGYGPVKTPEWLMEAPRPGEGPGGRLAWTTSDRGEG